MYPIGVGFFGRRIKNVVKMRSKWKGPQKMQVKLPLSMFGRVLESRFVLLNHAKIQCILFVWGFLDISRDCLARLDLWLNNQEVYLIVVCVFGLRLEMFW